MLLAIDIGNTNINLAVFNGEEFIAKWRVATVDNRTADEYAAIITQLMFNDKIAKTDFCDIIISSVVPQVMMHINKMCRILFDKDPLIIGEDIIPEIEVDLDNPKEVGSDRVVNAISALKKYNAPIIIIDFGTATTFDVIDEKGSYVGGVISPGINLSLNALQAFAAKLPSMSVVEKPEKVLGKNTKDAMRSGIYWGYVGLIEGTLNRLQEELGYKTKVIATGGLAPLFAESVPAIEDIESDLTILGLKEIYGA